MNKNELVSNSSDADVEEEVEVIDSVAVESATVSADDDWCTPLGGDSNISNPIDFTGMFISENFPNLIYSQDPPRKRLNWVVQIQMIVTKVTPPVSPHLMSTSPLAGVMLRPLEILLLVVVAGVVKHQISMKRMFHGSHRSPKVLISFFSSISSSFSGLSDTYPTLESLMQDFADPPRVKTLYHHLDKVQNLTWGDFLHSIFLNDWLLGFCRGDFDADDFDYEMANCFLDRLPGFADSGSVSGRGWSVMEELYPGRFINMKTLKTEIMQVRILLENPLIIWVPPGIP